MLCPSRSLQGQTWRRWLARHPTNTELKLELGGGLIAYETKCQAHMHTYDKIGVSTTPLANGALENLATTSNELKFAWGATARQTRPKRPRSQQVRYKSGAGRRQARNYLALTTEAAQAARPLVGRIPTCARDKPEYRYQPKHCAPRVQGFPQELCPLGMLWARHLEAGDNVETRSAASLASAFPNTPPRFSLGSEPAGSLE